MDASELVAPAARVELLAIAPATRPVATVPVATEEPLSVFGLEFSLDTASLDALEEVTRALTKAQIVDRFDRSLGTEEVALLSTCHRVELAILARSRDELDLWRAALPGDGSRWRVRSGRDAVRHLFRVAAGLESLAVGEEEVRHQVRAVAGSVVSRHPRPVLRELLARAANAADEALPSAQTSSSIAAVAAARLLALVENAVPRVLVVGSGTVGRQLVHSLAPRARVTVAFHRQPPEEAFLRATGARAVRFDRLAEEIATSDAVVTAAKFGNHGLRATDLPRDRPLLLLDLGVPRNIDPAVRELPNIRLVDLEELHALTGRLARTDELTARVEQLAELFSDRLERLLLESWIDAVYRTAEEVRSAELAKAGSYLGNLSPSQAAAIERLTQRLVARLLLPAAERIRALPLGPDGDRERRFAVRLLSPRSAGP